MKILYAEIDNKQLRLKNNMYYRALMLVGALCASLFSIQANAVALKDIGFSSLAGDRTEVTLSFDGVPPEPKGYTIEKPARIALDLSGVTNDLSAKYHSLGSGNAQGLTIVSAKDRTRLIVNLVELVPYASTVDGNNIVLMIGSADAPKASSASKSKSKSVVSNSAGKTAVTGVDFRRGEKGDGQVILTLSSPKIDVDMSEEGGLIKLFLADVDLPEALERRLDVADFATPVKRVDSRLGADGVEISIKPEGNYDYLAYQADNQFTISVEALTPEEVDQRKKDKFPYTGEKLSLNFQDIEVRSVLQLIADFTGLNLVASDTVGGRITLRLQNVPWDQALDLVLKTKGLDKRQIGNVLMVAPAAEIAERERQEIETNKQLEELAPLQTEFIRIRYANAAELFKLFNSDEEEDEGNTATGSILSPRGRVIVDERTNSLLVTETVAKLDEFRRLVKLIDVPVRQVLIEARIVVADSDHSEQLGIRWGGGGFVKGVPQAGDDFFSFGGNSATTSGLNNAIVGGTAPTINFPDALNIDLGVTEIGTSSVAIGFGGDGFLLDLELSAFESAGHGEVVSQPKVITGDKQQATIKSGTEVPFLESSSSGRTTVKFKDAVLKLDVTPNITPDDRILMRLVINQDSVGGFIAGENNSQIPLIDVTELVTEVLVGNGETVVLGGVYRTEDVRSEVKTPLLGDIPYLGRLFRRSNDRRLKTETLIFITPRILSDTLVD